MILLSRRVACRLILLLCAAALPATTVLAGERLLVFAAASLSGPLAQVAALFEKTTGVTVTLSHASTSTLARQIEQGAPAAVFVSANPQWMDHLAAIGLLIPGSRFDWLGNRLVVVAPADASGSADLALTLAHGRIAMGDPAHVPAGIYAREALRSLGLWEQAAARIVPAVNVRAALAMVARGEAAHGIVYVTDARLEPGVTVLHTLPESSHARIRYPVAALAPPNEDAQRFVVFLRSKPAGDLMRAAGFDVLTD